MNDDEFDPMLGDEEEKGTDFEDEEETGLPIEEDDLFNDEENDSLADLDGNEY